MVVGVLEDNRTRADRGVSGLFRDPGACGPFVADSSSVRHPV